MNRELLDREWLVGAPKSADQLTVFQWNCLADWASDSFPRVDASFLDWEYRKPRIIAEIVRANPDIACLQEVDHFEELKALLAPNYEGYFKAKGIDPETPGRDGGAIFWKRDRLSIRDQVNSHFAATCNQPGMKQVMLSPEFQFKLSNDQVASVRIVATHLKAKAGFDEQRRLQCNAMAQFLNALGERSDLTIVCGDFNTERDSGAVTGLLDRTRSVELESAYHLLNKAKSGTGCEPAWTTWKIRDKVKKTTIDFIFSDKQSSWKPVDVWQIPADDQIDESVALPCKAYPSDHLALASKFEFRN